MIHEFNLQNLTELDNGRIPEAWRQALERVAKDCDDRPAVKKPRKVTLECEVVPVLQQEGAVLDSLTVTFKVKDTVPTRETKPYSVGFRKKRGQPHLVFNDMSDDNVHQKTLDEQE